MHVLYLGISMVMVVVVVVVMMMSLGLDCVSELRLPRGLLFIPR
jgi:hypothetical protein